MAKQFLTKVEIDGVNVGNKLRGWIKNEQFGDVIGDIKLELVKSIYNLIPDLRPGMTIKVWRGKTTSTDQFVFDGLLDRIDKKGGQIFAFGKDNMVKLLKLSVLKSYDGKAFPATESKGSDIARSLIEVYGGMDSFVVDTGSVHVLDKFICNGVDIFGRLMTLANIYDYQVYFNAEDQKVHFEPKGFTAPSTDTTLYVGGPNRNVNNLPHWKFDNSQCVNKLIVKGAVQEVTDDEFFDGDNTALQQFTLSKQPIIVHVFEDVAGNLIEKVPGVVDSTSGTFDYTIDKENKLIKCTSNWTPAVGSNNVFIQYSNAIPVPIQVEDVSSQSLYGIYFVQKYFDDIQDVNDAEQRGNGYLAKYSTPFVESMLIPGNLIDYNVGNNVRVIDILNDIDLQVTINTIKKKYPSSGDQLFVGDGTWRLAQWGKFTLERIRRLEEVQDKNTDLLIQIRSEEVDITPEVMYLDVQKKSLVNNGFILDNPNNAILDTSRLGSPFQSNGFLLGTIDNGILGTNALGGSFESENLIRRTWFNRIYTEDFRDNDFNGGGTGTWDIVTRTLTL